MIVTNKDIDKDIAENLMIRHDVIKSDVARDMMLYMRDIYERKIETLSKDNAIMESALNAVGSVDAEDAEDDCGIDEENICEETNDSFNCYGEDLSAEKEMQNIVEELTSAFANIFDNNDDFKPEDAEYAMCAGIGCIGKEACANYFKNIDGELGTVIENASTHINYVNCIESGHTEFITKQ